MHKLRTNMQKNVYSIFANVLQFIFIKKKFEQVVIYIKK